MPLENTAVIETPTPEGADDGIPANLTNLHELLSTAEDIPLEDGEKGAAAGNGEQNAKPEMFNDLAESMGIELDDLYALKVSIADGETVTIQELKALQTTHDEIAVRELEFEETKASKEGDLRQAQNEIAEIVAELPEGSLTPKVLEKLRSKNAVRIAEQQTQTMNAIPTWKDETARTADMKGMTTHLERFGFPRNYLASVVDHRQMVFIRESYLREQRIKNALSRVRAGAPNPTPGTKTIGKAPARTSGKPKNSNTRNGLEAFFSDL